MRRALLCIRRLADGSRRTTDACAGNTARPTRRRWPGRRWPIASVAGQDGSEDLTVKNQFHDLQERINYFCGWLSSESPELGAAYTDLVRECKTQCRPLIQAAWAERPLPLSEPRPADEAQPQLDTAKERFLNTVRDSFPGLFTN